MAMIRLFLAGDVMTGRGIDQILPHPSEPQLFEDDLTSALDYVALAERTNGEIRRPAGFDYIWGGALEELSRRKPRARIVNLETAVTKSGTPEPKGINYRMNPANVPALTAAGIDCCMLSNNHVLDWGESGLLDTLAALQRAGIHTAGAGRDLPEASRPAVIDVNPSRRILVFGLGLESSGIPLHWEAGANRAGVRLLRDLSKVTAHALASEIIPQKRLGDVVVLSIHWGSNWGYKIDVAQQAFAHTLIDLGACDILHGHSSHHARPIEIYRQKLILYGCGDFINDYEGIRGYEEYRADLAPMYLAEVDDIGGTLAALTIVLFRMRRFRLGRASLDEVQWFQSVINKYSQDFAARLSLDADASLSLAPPGSRQ